MSNTFDKENINDRFGFHHVMMAVAIWPTLLVSELKNLT